MSLAGSARRALVRSVYTPLPYAETSTSLEALLGERSPVMARTARELLYLLLASRRPRGNVRVLVPSFICRDVVDAVVAAGADPCYYGVTSTLTVDDFSTWPAADVVVAVNYFGFPQDLAPFHAYVAQVGALLIEDNAHGFLSRDQAGAPLGTRAPIGLFSFRKTIAVENGAALVGDLSKLIESPAQILKPSVPASLRFRLKQAMRPLASVVGVYAFRRVLRAVRWLHQLIWRRSRASEVAEAGTSWVPTSPYRGFSAAIAMTDAHREVARRRALYKITHETLHVLGAEPVFSELPAGVSPYGYPFRADPEHLEILRAALDQVGLDVYPWPDLPAGVVLHAPAWYKEIWFVPFLW